MKKIFVATPTYNNNLHLGYVQSMFLIQEEKKNFEVKFNFISGSLINRCRNELLAIFLNSDFDYIFFIDSDLSDFNNAFFDVVKKYIELEKENPLLITGALYPIKELKFERIPDLIKSNVKPEDAHKFLMSFNFNCDTPANNLLDNCKNNNGWLDVNALGGGFMMFSKNLVLKLIKNNPDSMYLRYPNQNQLPEKLYDLFKSFVEKENNMYLSEDYGFCYLVKKLSGKIFVNMFHEIGHIGSYKYKGEPVSQAVYSFLTKNKY